jgi:uncharacterized membrane protein
MSVTLKQKAAILFAIWLRGLLAVLFLGLCSGALGWVQGASDGKTLRIVIVSAILPGLLAYLKNSPLPKLPKELYDEVKDDLANNTEQFTKQDVNKTQ